MPVKKKMDKKKKLKQKQKQKQVVKQNVKVTVQSSGGSGGGGSSMPQAFTDRSGENIRLQNLIDQLTRQPIQAPVAAPIAAPIAAPVQFQAPAKAPAKPKQRITVIKQPAESIAPSFEEQAIMRFQEMSGKPQYNEMEQAMMRAKIKAMEAQADVPNFVGDAYMPNNDDETVKNVFSSANTNNNSIAENIFSNNLREADPVAFEDNESEIQSVISGISNVSETTRQKQLKSNLADIEQRKKELAGLAALGEYQRKKAEETFIKAGASPEQIAKISKPFFSGEEEASFISSSSSSAPSSVTSSAPSRGSSAPSKVSSSLFKQIDDLNTKIKQETAKEKALIGEPAKKQFDYVNTLIEKKLALQEQAAKPKVSMVEKAAISMEADAPYGRFKNGKPRKSPSV